MKFSPMTLPDLDAVLAIECTAYPFPWTRGNFTDCIESGYAAETLRIDDQIVGYLIAAAMVDEVHVLNCCVAPAWQGRGLGQVLMRRLMQRLPEMGAASVLLEVRASNAAAQRLYEKLGFAEIGRRRGYYPTTEGLEDARVLRYVAK